MHDFLLFVVLPYLSLAVFLIPVIMYALLSHFLFKWSRAEFVDATPAAEPEPTDKNDSNHGIS